jgi:tellurite resistance protein TehA-like permease
MVMATGIVAIACQLTSLRWLAVALSWSNIVIFAVLWSLTLARVALYPREFFHDLIDHKRGPGFFTIVAGTSVLGRQQIIIFNHYGAATALWFLALPLWAGFTYAIFTGFTVKEDKPSLAEGIHGGWLIAVVATQAVSSLEALPSSRNWAINFMTHPAVQVPWPAAGTTMCRAFFQRDATS